MRLRTPVALVIFNRPHLVKTVFDVIARVKPEGLFVMADGPRYLEEAQSCQEARSIIDRVDWDCKVMTNFADRNLGCRLRIVSGLNWLFSQVEEAIILEDDCLPDPSFFHFCQTLLDYYRHDEQIMEIGCVNYQFGRKRTEDSYYFSKYGHTNGWATWRRAWKCFDENILFWPELKMTKVWNSLCDDLTEKLHWELIYDRIYKGKFNTSWDYQWQLARWCQNGLSIVPNVNLVSNIGFGPGATHSLREKDPLARLPVQDIGKIRHPSFVVRHKQADKYFFYHVLKGGLLRTYLRKILYSLPPFGINSVRWICQR